MWTYFDIQITHDFKARFRRNAFTGTIQVFQFNCAPAGQNEWHEPGYGYGAWTAVVP